jgi:tetratricopeptide (TPR) repeat protein
MQQNEKKPMKTSDKVLNFIGKNRKGLLIGLVCIVLGIVILTVVYAVSESTAKKAVAELDVYSDRLIAADKEAPETAELVAEIEQFAEGKSRFVGAEAYSLVANYHADKDDWVAAEAAWLKAAAKAPKDYLAPSALFNAAVAAEEQGNTSKAVDYYTQAAEFQGIFGGKVRAYFAIGRLYEAENNITAALEMYQKITDDYPSDELAKLAQSRIIVLSN